MRDFEGSPNKRAGSRAEADCARARIEQLKKVVLAVPPPPTPTDVKPNSSHVFDGAWTVQLVGGPGCNVKTGTARWLVRNSEVIARGKVEGAVDQQGRFKLATPNLNYPGVTAMMAGTFKADGSGSGSYVMSPANVCT